MVPARLAVGVVVTVDESHPDAGLGERLDLLLEVRTKYDK